MKLDLKQISLSMYLVFVSFVTGLLLSNINLWFVAKSSGAFEVGGLYFYVIGVLIVIGVVFVIFRFFYEGNRKAKFALLFISLLNSVGNIPQMKYSFLSLPVNILMITLFFIAIVTTLFSRQLRSHFR